MVMKNDVVLFYDPFLGSKKYLPPYEGKGNADPDSGQCMVYVSFLRV